LVFAAILICGPGVGVGVPDDPQPRSRGSLREGAVERLHETEGESVIQFGGFADTFIVRFVLRIYSFTTKNGRADDPRDRNYYVGIIAYAFLAFSFFMYMRNATITTTPRARVTIAVRAKPRAPLIRPATRYITKLIAATVSA